ncbi:MAG: hypothetical protein A3F12_02715 [Gammaproteobacteria bacterium RIFCSPHIGHO2_12_FULL_38_14]|nr:MAG: hypothetical protein A3F12_02715 [Gammaproteobacteria bacterium RIFCSPHIGHO2_12_FULL_38_14]
MRKLMSQKIAIFKNKEIISALEIAQFFRQFATLISSGIQIVQSFEILEKNEKNQTLKSLIFSTKQMILSGKKLSYAIQRKKQYFDDLTYQLIKIGEHTGHLDQMLLTIASHQEQKITYKNKVKQMLFYPAIVILSALITVFVLFIFIIPRFSELFQDMQKLPLFTRLLFQISFVFKECSLIITIMIGLVILFFRSDHAVALQIKKYSVRQLLRLPVIKVTFIKIILSRFTRNLSILQNAHLPLLDALKLAGDTVSNEEFKIVIKHVCNKINTGSQLHRAMATFSCFPHFMIQMIKIGEESGTLETMLIKIADFYESEINQFFNTLQNMVEPLIIIILGVLIGGLVIGIYLPIFNLGNTI